MAFHTLSPAARALACALLALAQAAAAQTDYPSHPVRPSCRTPRAAVPTSRPG